MSQNDTCLKHSQKVSRIICIALNRIETLLIPGSVDQDGCDQVEVLVGAGQVDELGELVGEDTLGSDIRDMLRNVPLETFSIGNCRSAIQYC